MLVEAQFSFQTLTSEQRERTERIRVAAKHLAQTIVDCTESCADRAAAIRKVREAMMTANASIAVEGTS